MKLNNLTLLSLLLVPMASPLLAQSQGLAPVSSSSSVIPSQGVIPGSTVTPSQGASVGTGVTATQPSGIDQSAAIQAQDAQNAQVNAAQANPSQAAQQPQGGGVFGPSRGPGIFGPAGGSQPQAQQQQQQQQTQPTTNYIYTNQQPAAGTADANGNVTSQRPGQAQNIRRPGQVSGSVNGVNNSESALPENGQIQNETPRSLQPLTTNPNQQRNTAPAGTVTGR